MTLPIRLVQLFALIRKELRQISSDPLMLRVLIAAPLLQLLVFGNAVNFEVDRVPTWIVDQDASARSRGVTAALLADGTLEGAGTTTDPAEAMDAMDAGQAAAVIVIPDGFDRDLLRGDRADVQVIIDGTDPNRATVAAAAAGRYFAEVGATDVRGPSLSLVPRVYFNPSLVTAVYMVPGVMAMLLVIVTTLVTAMGIAREREAGTLEQVLVTPIPQGVLLAGKILPYVGIGFFDVLLALAAGMYVFGVPFRGSVPLFLLATVFYLLCTVGIGLLISTAAATQQQAFMLGFLFLIPAVLLSGNMTPVAAMPDSLQPLTALDPLRYYIEILRSDLLEGATIADMGWQLGALAFYGVVLFTLAVLRFSKRVA